MRRLYKFVWGLLPSVFLLGSADLTVTQRIMAKVPRKWWKYLRGTADGETGLTILIAAT